MSVKDESCFPQVLRNAVSPFFREDLIDLFRTLPRCLFYTAMIYFLHKLLHVLFSQYSGDYSCRSGLKWQAWFSVLHPQRPSQKQSLHGKLLWTRIYSRWWVLSMWTARRVVRASQTETKPGCHLLFHCSLQLSQSEPGSFVSSVVWLAGPCSGAAEILFQGPSPAGWPVCVAAATCADFGGAN